MLRRRVAEWRCIEVTRTGVPLWLLRAARSATDLVFCMVPKHHRRHQQLSQAKLLLIGRNYSESVAICSHEQEGQAVEGCPEFGSIVCQVVSHTLANLKSVDPHNGRAITGSAQADHTQ